MQKYFAQKIASVYVPLRKFWASQNPSYKCVSLGS